jgi:hypothetical protein
LRGKEKERTQSRQMLYGLQSHFSKREYHRNIYHILPFCVISTDRLKPSKNTCLPQTFSPQYRISLSHPRESRALHCCIIAKLRCRKIHKPRRHFQFLRSIASCFLSRHTIEGWPQRQQRSPKSGRAHYAALLRGAQRGL